MPSIYNPLTNRYHEVDDQVAQAFQPGRESIYNPLTGGYSELSAEDALLFYPERAERPAPVVDRDVEWADYGKSIMSGGASVASGLGWLADKIDGDTGIGKAIQNVGNNAVDYWNESLSDAAKGELAKEFVRKTDDGYEWGDASWSTVGLLGAQSLLGTATGMGLGAGATKVLQLFGNPVGREALVRGTKLLEKARPGSKAWAIGDAARRKLKFVDTVLGAVGFGIGEGTVGGAMTGVNVETEVKKLPLEKLMENERFRQVYDSADGLMDEAQRFEYARDTIAKEAASVTGFQAGITTGVLGAPMGAYFGPLLSKVATGRTGSIVKGGLGEAAQEFAQSGTEQRLTNRTLINLGDERDPWEGVLNAAVGGAAAGAPMGAVMATAGPTDRQQAAQEKKFDDMKVGGVNYGPLVARSQEAKAAGATDEELLPILQKARQPGQMLPALAELRRLRDAKLAETAQTNISMSEKTEEKEAVAKTEQAPEPTVPATAETAASESAPEIRPTERPPEARSRVEQGLPTNEQSTTSVPEPTDTLAEYERLAPREPVVPPAPTPPEEPPKVKGKRTFDPQQDSLLTAVSKLGGLNRAEAESEGIDPDHWKDSGYGIKRISTKNGRTVDDLAEALAEAGYPTRDEAGRTDKNAMLDLIDEELRGRPIYSSHGADRQAERDSYDREFATYQQEQALYDAIYSGDPEYFPEPGLPETEYDPAADREAQTLVDLYDRAAAVDQDAADAIMERDQGDGQTARQLWELTHADRLQETAAEGSLAQPGEVEGEAGRSAPDDSDAQEKETAQAETDLLGDDTRSAQALADETRRRDEARNAGQDSLETGDPSDLFSEARKQTDLVAAAAEPELVDEADPLEQTRANIAGESPERASLIILRDMIEIGTDVMNDGQFPADIRQEASELSSRIDAALESGEDLSEIQQQATERVREWLKGSEFDASEANELRSIQNVIESQTALPAPAAKTDTDVTALPAPDFLTAEEIQPNKKLTAEQREVEQRFIDYLTSTPWPELVAQYNALTEETAAESTQGGRILSVDAFKELSEDYRNDRSLSAAVQEPSSAAIKKLYAQRLQEQVPVGREPEAMLTAGGTGSGKTSTLRDAAAGDLAHVILDGNLASLESARTKVQQALDAGKRVYIAYVYKDPIMAFEAAISRTKRLEAEYGTGRPVPIWGHAGTHTGAEKTVKALAKEYADDRRVRIEAFDNSGKKGEATRIAIEDVPELDYNSIVTEARRILEDEKGNLSEQSYRAFLGTGPVLEGGTEQVSPAGTEAGTDTSELSEPDRPGTRQAAERTQTGVTDESQPLPTAGARPLEGLPAEPVSGVQGSRVPGESAGERGAADATGDVAGAGGRDTARSGVGGNQGSLFAPDTGGDADAGQRTESAAGRTPRREPRDSESPRPAVASDYRITDADLSDLGGPKTRARANMDAIRLVQKLDDEQRFATPEEQKVLIRYVGWGGIPQIFAEGNSKWTKEYAELKGLLTEDQWKAARSSTRNAHYTRPEVIRSMYRALQGLGFKAGRVLEPAVGTGHFIGLMPSSLKANFTGVEMDTLTGKIAGYLYPSSKINAATRFEEFTAPLEYFDAVIGNPPFGSEKVFDANFKASSKFSIHNYFFGKSLELTRPGGVVVMVVSNNLLDQKNSAARMFMSNQAKLLGAIRLPNNAFKANANTEVTTDIVFLQKLKEGEQPARDWVATDTVPDALGGEDIRINSYFSENRDMMIGRMERAGSMYGPDQPALIWDGQGDLEKLINDRVDRIVSEHGAVMDESDNAVAELEAASVAELDVSEVKAKPFGYFVAPDGSIHQRLPDIGAELHSEKLELGPTVIARMKAMVDLRDATRAQLRKEMTDAVDIEEHRKLLNQKYDAFAKKFGFVNAQANSRAFREDPDYPLMQSLESNYDKGLTAAAAKKTGKKAKMPSAGRGPILQRRVRRPYQPVTKVTNAKDALAATLSQTGRIDRDLIERIYAKPFEEAMTELGDLVYESLDGQSWQTAEEYLSGNVKAKLSEALQAAHTDPRFDRNVEALIAIQPADVDPVDIGVSANSPWIGNDTAEAFAKHLFGEDANVKVRMLPAVGEVKLSITGANATSNTSTYGTDRMSGVALLDKLMNNKPIKVYDRISKDQSVLNQEATSAALEKAEKIREEFANWIWADQDRRTKLARIYNDTFNTSVERRFNGDHLGIDSDGNEIPLPGSSAAIILDKHQKDYVWRFMQTGKALADHVVGAGKTFASIAAAMERKRIGLMQKPMFVVPNHLVGQWAAEFNVLYPGANVLAATKKDFEKKNRARFLAKVATGDWDAIIIAHSSFERIGMPLAALKKFMNDQIADYEAAIREAKEEGGRDISVKDLERSKENLEAKLKEKMAAKAKDKVVDFDELGIDGLIVDESHAFKNLQFPTKLGRTIAGLGTTTGSQRALDMFVKTRYVQELNGGGNVQFLSGTPISNSMSEMFTLQRYLQLDTLRSMNLQHFDAWAAQFGEVAADWEIKSTGTGYELKSRFRRFRNIKQLIDMYREFADVITRDQINEVRISKGKPELTPPIKGGAPQNIVTPRTDEQAAYMGLIVERAENLKNVDPDQDNMLKITNDARKMALDMRLIDPAAGDDPQNKSSIVSKRVKELYDQWNHVKGTQLVFIDLSTPKGAKGRETARIAEILRKAEEGDEAAIQAMGELSIDQLEAINAKFDVYNDIKAKLIDSGIPDHEIAFIHDANTELQKENLFEQVRRGEVRVLLGSTAKMGAGMNVQTRLVALHHADAPWRPSDLEQREGRIIRQGNILYSGDQNTGFKPIQDFEIEINRYAVEQTYDSRMWQTIEGKARIIEQARTGNLGESSMEDIAGEAANAAQMKALASGNPLIEEEVRLRGEIRKLEMSKNQHTREQHQLQDTIRRLKGFEVRADRRRADIQKDIDRAVQLVDGKFPGIKVDGKFHTKKPAGGGALALQIVKFMKVANDSTDTIAEYRGFPLSLFKSGNLPGIELSAGHANYQTLFAEGAKLDPTGIVQRLDNLIANFDRAMQGVEDQRKRDAASLKEAERNTGQPFKQELELQQKKERHKVVLAELSKTDEEKKTPKQPPPDTAVASRPKARGAGSTTDAVRKHLAGAIDAVSPLLTVRVVQSVNELPANAMPSDIEGAYFNRGAVYLVADNLSAERIDEVFRHEVFGHAAMERHPDFAQWLKQIQRARLIKNSDVQKLAAEVTARQGLLDPVTEAKEIIALMAERGVKSSLMDRIAAAFRKFFRSIGLTKDVSEAEIRTWLSKGARQFMADAEFARRVPGATLTAESTDEEVLAAINAVYPDDRIDSQPLFSRAKASETVEAAMARVMVTPNEDLTVGDRVRGVWRELTNFQEGRLKQGFLDSAHSIRMLEEGLFGEVLDATDSAYKATLATKNLPSVIAAILKRGAPKIANGVFQPVNGRKGVIEIFKPVTNHADGNLLAQWEFFAAANRASRLIGEKNRDGTAREKNFTPADIEAGLSLEQQYPFFRDVLNEWTAFNGQILDLAQSAGVVNAEERALWEQNDYVPFYRAMEEGVQGPRKGKGTANVRSGIKRLEGGEAPLGSVFENMMMNVAHLVDASFRNVAMQRTTAMAEQTGAMEKMPPQWAPIDVDNKQIAKRLKDAGIDVGDMTPEQREGWSKVFRRVAPRGNDVVSVLVDGKPEWYRVTDPMLLSSITLMGQESFSALMGLFRAPKRWLTTGVTATPEFMLANLIRDTLSTWVVSDVRKNPFKGIASAMKATFTENEDLMAIMMAGAGGGGYYDSNPEQIRKLLAKEMPRGKVDGFMQTVLSPKKAWQFWQRVGASTENANRIAIFRQVVANGGSVAEAAYQARDVLNFTMSGDFSAIRVLIQTVPFLNARIQGLYRLARGAKANPKAFAVKGLMLMGISLALLLRNNDREEYEELPDWERDIYWHVFLGDGQHIRIPKPFEVGAMFATLPERLIRTAGPQDDMGLLAERVSTMIFDTFAFNPLPQAVKPLIEQYANRNMFTGSPIIGMAEEGLEPEAQYTHYTSETMRAFAEGMPDSAPDWMRSPKRLEAAIRGYFGTLGMYALSTSDAMVRTLGGYPAPPAMTIYDAPVVQRFFRSGEPRQSRYQDMLYNMLDESNQVFRTINRYKSQGLMDKARDLQGENVSVLQVRAKLNRVQTAVRKLNAQMKLVSFNKTLTPAEKRTRMDELTAKRNAILATVAPFEEVL